MTRISATTPSSGSPSKQDPSILLSTKQPSPFERFSCHTAHPVPTLKNGPKHSAIRDKRSICVTRENLRTPLPFVVGNSDARCGGSRIACAILRSHRNDVLATIHVVYAPRGFQ